MIKQSAYVIALLLGTASAHTAAPESVSLFATGMNGDEDLGQDIIMKGEKFHYVGKDAGLVQLQEDPTPEKVVVMEPIPNQALSNGAGGEGLEAFPNAPRTAFYMQYDKENQLWRQELAQGPLPYTQQVAGPDVGAPIGKTVHDAALDGCDAQPMDRKPNGKYAQMSEPGDGYGQDGPANLNPNLGESRRDKWVYEFSRENMPPFATHAKINRGKKDIGEGNIDESVHTFASEDTNVLPLPRRRRDSAYAGNGSGEKAHSLMEKVHHHHHHNKDIGEGNIDEEVHGVATADTHVLPEQWRRVESAYAPNGSGEKAHSLHQLHHHHHHHKKDIGEGNIDEEVHGVASADTHVLPMPRRRRETAYANNGSGEKSHSLVEAVHYRNKKDIGEGNIDEEVHGVASADTHVLPMPRRRRETAYANNGSGEKSHSLYQRNKKDIGEGNIDEEVHGVASADTHVLPMPRRRRETAYANNGSGEKSHSLAELEKGDIANKQVRTDVYTTVDNMIGQIPAYRRKTAPKHKFAPFKSGQGVEGDNNGPSGVITATKGGAAVQQTPGAGADVQLDGDDKGDKKAEGDIGPEKVSDILPLEYQHRANTNTPNKRTTFYAEQQ